MPKLDLRELAALAQLYTTMQQPVLAQRQQQATEDDRQLQGILALLGLHQHSQDAEASRLLQQQGLDQAGKFHGEDNALRESEGLAGRNLTREGLTQAAQFHGEDSLLKRQAMNEESFRGDEAAIEHRRDRASQEKSHHDALVASVLPHLVNSPTIDPELQTQLLRTIPEFAHPIDAFQETVDTRTADALRPAFNKAGDAALGGASPGVRAKLQKPAPLGNPFSPTPAPQHDLPGLPRAVGNAAIFGANKAKSLLSIFPWLVNNASGAVGGPSNLVPYPQQSSYYR